MNQKVTYIYYVFNYYSYGTHGAFMSSKDQIEVDCRQRRIRLIYSSDHPQALCSNTIAGSLAPTF